MKLFPIIIFFGTLAVSACSSQQQPMQYLKNDKLKTIKPGYKGNAWNGKIFMNYEDVPLPGFMKVMKWQLSRNPQREEKKKDTWKPAVNFNPGMFSDTTNKIVWLGHASFLITVGGKNILTDPVFGDIPFVKRKVGLPFKIDDVRNIDYVLISHGHFDHCDKKSLKALAAQNPGMKILCPLKLSNVITGFTGNVAIEEAAWYQQFDTGSDGPEIYCMPAFHWFKRGLTDDNTCLWGSYVIRYGGKTFYFMGDSGYNTHFKEIAGFFPDIDVCMMGVGAYKPAYIMKTSHHTPGEAVQAFHDLKGKVLIPMHYGTFDLADEPMGEPYRMLQEMNRKNEIHGELKALQIGETWKF
jgi:L-ascorbate metabolism protein UlaG (beta-lactamase superfamily)